MKLLAETTFMLRIGKMKGKFEESKGWNLPISVRDPCTCKTEVQLFKENSYFTKVYDWVGSLSPVEFFNIGNCTTIITPDKKVYSAVFDMVETNTPLPMTPEGTVAFTGYRLADQSVVNKSLDQLRIVVRIILLIVITYCSKNESKNTRN